MTHENAINWSWFLGCNTQTLLFFFYLLGIALKCNCFKYILQCTWMVFILGIQWLNNSRCFVLLTLPCQSNWGVNDKFRTHWLLHKHFQNYTNVRVPCINSVSEIFWIVYMSMPTWIRCSSIYLAKYINSVVFFSRSSGGWSDVKALSRPVMS